MRLGEVSAEWAANAAGAINWGFPTIADTDIPELHFPMGVEHVVGTHLRRPYDRQIQVRGLKVAVTEIPIPVSYGLGNERVRKDDIYLECGWR